MTVTALSATGLGKRYTIEHASMGPSPADLRETIAQGWASVRRRLASGGLRRASPTREEFWALRDVSLSIAQGEVVGFLGRNGAGKSTLLKLISRITEPSAGELRIRGRVGSLLEVGTGFHPELTGRENIFLNGAILGMSRAEIRRKFDPIVEFAEVERFLDTPVKRFSSGMYVRLAFAVAAHLEPEVLIVDEVLTVGDTAFQAKCLARMHQVAAEGRTVLFVSHNLGLVRSLCRRGVVLEAGRVTFDGPAGDAIHAYLGSLERASARTIAEWSTPAGGDAVRLQGLEVEAPASRDLEAGQPARFVFRATRQVPGLACVFDVYDAVGQHVTFFDSANTSPDDAVTTAGAAAFCCDVPELLLVPGRYRIDVALLRDGELLQHVEGAAFLDVRDGVAERRRVVAAPGYGAAFMRHRWTRSGTPEGIGE